MKSISFKEICDVFSQVDKISSRNEMTEILSELYKKLDIDDSQIVTYLMQGRLAPMFVKSEFGYSEKSIVNVLTEWAKAESMDLNIQTTREDSGDIGDTTEIFIKELGKTEERYSLREIYEIFWKIVYTSGTGSVDRKNDIIVSTLKNLTPLEAKYFARIICGSLRLGINVKTLLDVFSFVRVGDKSLRPELDRVYGVCADPGVLLMPNWESVTTTPGIPVLSRLVERVADFQEVFDRLGSEVLVQPKFDGLRCQIHKIDKTKARNDSVDSIWMDFIKKEEKLDLFGSSGAKDADIKLFTRNLEDVTEMFPEIVDAARSLGMDSFILDSEVLGWDYKNDTFLTYQETMQRRRKYDVSKLSDSIPVKAQTFDILFRNGENLLNTDTYKRVEILKKELKDTSGGIALAETEIVSDIKSLDELFEMRIAQGYEGLIVKMKEGSYSPGNRDYEWIKLKKSMKKGLVDTFDLVVVGYLKGSGRRSDLGVGALLGAIYNEDKDVFETVCKVGTGIGDDMLKEIYVKLEEIKLKDIPKDVLFNKNIKADVWVAPKYVITVEADEVSKNIAKSSGAVADGMSLRFPRLIEFGRDKNPYEATTLEELNSIFEKQKKVI